jgi:S-adenosylmethionine-diacylglycerol 3-amino-3-carboxypropyl transferase
MLTQPAVSQDPSSITVEPKACARAARRFPRDQKGPTPAPILKRPVLERLLFAQCWEDPRMDAESLCLQPGKTALVVTSGGCTALSLALLRPDRILAVDLNAAQSHLLQLKIAGAKRLAHPGYLELLGVRTSNRRGRLYVQCRTALPPPAAAFWDSHLPLIEAGVLRAGRYERYLAAFRLLLLLIEGRRKVEQLFAPRSSEDRRRFYEEQWNTHLWRLCFRLFFSRPVLGAIGLDRSFFTYVYGIEDFGTHFLHLTRHALVDLSPHESYFAAQICLGRYLDERTMPPYLLAENYPVLQSAVNRIEVLTVELGSLLAQMPSCSVDAFAYSNIFEWSPPDVFEECLRQTQRVGRPNARLCYRNLLVKRHTPSALTHLFRPETAMAGRLLAEDRSWVYSHFEVATILKTSGPERGTQP